MSLFTKMWLLLLCVVSCHAKYIKYNTTGSRYGYCDSILRETVRSTHGRVWITVINATSNPIVTQPSTMFTSSATPMMMLGG